MIVQTFSLDDLLNGDEEGVPDPLADYRKLSYREQLEDLQRKHHDIFGRDERPLFSSGEAYFLDI